MSIVYWAPTCEACGQENGMLPEDLIDKDEEDMSSPINQPCLFCKSDSMSWKKLAF